MQNGFTIIELVVVIVVLGILTAIAVPRFIDLSEKAKQSVCDNNVAAINSALQLKFLESAVNGNAAYPDTLTAELFSNGRVPVCPYGWKYVYVSANGTVAKHIHSLSRVVSKANVLSSDSVIITSSFSVNPLIVQRRSGRSRRSRWSR